jgi:hypothetical protein
MTRFLRDFGEEAEFNFSTLLNVAGKNSCEKLGILFEGFRGIVGKIFDFTASIDYENGKK